MVFICIFSLAEKTHFPLVAALELFGLGFFFFLIASLLRAFLDLLSDAKKTSDRTEQMLQNQIDQFNRTS